MMATEVREFLVEIDHENSIATSHFPGITYDDYDREGIVSPWKICRMFEAGRVVPLYQGNFLSYNDLVDQRNGYFVLGGDYYFDSCLWEVTRKYHYFPYKIEMELINAGQSSITVRQVLINSLDNKEVATQYCKLVYVNKITRKTQPFPYWFRKKHGVKDSSEVLRVDFSDYDIPSSAFKLTTVVTASDTDVNGHTNQASYVRYCLDAAASATRENKLRRLTHDICLYPILKMSNAYRSETLIGDQITTYVWQDDLSPHTLYFAIHTRGNVAYTSSIKFKQIPYPSKL